MPTVAKIEYRCFRGLPKTTIKLKDEKKNLLLYAGNGKGKSSVVQGLEWMFSGEVEDLANSDCLRHVDAKDDDPTQVSITYKDDEGQAVRKLEPNATVTGNGAPHIDNHPRPSSFILRRSKLLNFMVEAPSSRFNRFLELMGMEWIGKTQQAFEDAVAASQKDSEDRVTSYKTDVATLMRLSKMHILPNLASIYQACNTQLALLKEQPDVSSLEEIQERLLALKPLRAIDNARLLGRIENTLNTLSRTKDLDWDHVVASLNETRETIKTLQKEEEDAQISSVIFQASDLFGGNELEVCPVCEREFDEDCTFEAVRERLDRRAEALSKLKEAHQTNQRLTTEILNRMPREAAAIESTIRNTYEIFPEMIIPWATDALKDIKDSVKALLDEQDRPTLDAFDMPKGVGKMGKTKEKALKHLEKKKKALAANAPKEVNDAYMILDEAKRAVPIFLAYQQEAKELKTRHDNITKARAIFKKARKAALNELFNEISETVKKYYDFIHSDSDRSECSECSRVSITPADRGRRGGQADFATDFFDAVKDCDPRDYLSEGHLDSLGLCIYLACVEHFNPKGSLLVLDDVLTSVDADHRHKVTELIFNNFTDYQIILTTHSGEWHERLKSRIEQFQKDTWTTKSYSHWTREDGPSEDPMAGAVSALKNALQNKTLKEAGGPIRIVLEKLCKKSAAAFRIKVPYRLGGQYTAHDFKQEGLGLKLQEAIKRKLKKDIEVYKDVFKGDPENVALEERIKEAQKQSESLKQAVEKVFSPTLNELNHYKEYTEKTPEPELKGFVEALILLFQESKEILR